MKKIVMCFPLPTDNVGISYIALSIYKELRQQGRDVKFITPVIRRDAFGLGIKEVVPFFARYLPWKYLQKIAYHYYTREILHLANEQTVFDLWSDHTPELLAAIKQRGGLLLKEKFNTAQCSAKEILSAEYQRCGLPDRCSINDASIRSETAQLQTADFIFSPSPKVAESLIDAGVPEAKILPTSFGWDRRSVGVSQAEILSHLPHPRFLYVGSVEVRKGAHLLLDCWKEAQIEGTLVFLGAVRQEIHEHLKKYPPPANVVFLGHREKAHGIYHEVDVFVFPSLEEGGPLVTYEAMARGVPVIVSPMGAGAVARDDIDGYVIPPHNRAGWIEALRALAENDSLRMKFASQTKSRAESFTWDRVAQQRFELIQQAFGSHR